MMPTTPDEQRLHELAVQLEQLTRGPYPWDATRYSLMSRVLDDVATFYGPNDSPPVPHAWRDISTAPKDGTYVLLWWRSQLACGHWCDTPFAFGDAVRGWIGSTFDSRDPSHATPVVLGEQPTHWMPLPLPPT